ncbi:MAG TPA: HAD-IC family P-type ATPase, partial [Candidatus Tetragenococcus pullicola]|nr:HAD-IC family P-type ATPase [Candidatus Tetragenococcus pullicola]
MSQWYHDTKEEVLKSLDTDVENGLSEAEVNKRLESFGSNELEEQEKESIFMKVLGQLKDPMIIVLLIAAVLSYVSSGFQDWVEPVIILLIVVVNAIISISQENNADKSLEALQKMSAPLAKVIRNGKIENVNTPNLVPGDIVELEAGDLVPADARILSASNLKADESAMTGESVPVAKKDIDSLPEDTGLADRKNMLISSTVVTNGRATAVVTDTGMKTEVGRIANMLISEDDNTTPLQRKMAEISKVLSILCLGICVVMFVVGLLYSRPILEIFMMAVSLGVAAIPEGLAAIVTIVLALGVQRLVKRHAIVKKLPAVETLGAASVICSDKTGTLTQNKMTIVETYTTADQTEEHLLTIGTLCNDSKLSVEDDGSSKVTGDPTETAMVTKAFEEGFDKNALEKDMPRVADLPFESERKLMTTIHKIENGY